MENQTEPLKLPSADRLLGQGKDLFPRGEFEAGPWPRNTQTGSAGGKSLCKIVRWVLDWKENSQSCAENIEETSRLEDSVGLCVSSSEVMVNEDLGKQEMG